MKATLDQPPRRATVALDGSGPPPPNAGVIIYDKQLRWKQHGQKKVDHLTLERLSQEDLECTFAPKINRSASIKVASTGELSDGERSECSSSQYSVSSPRTIRSIDSVELRTSDQRMRPDATDPDDPILHPTESQEQSILLHLARYERARDDAQRAQLKLASTQPRKDFAKVTAARPFQLSVTNHKPRRSTSASPTKRVARARPRAGSTIASTSAGPQSTLGVGPQLIKRRSLGSTDESGGGTTTCGTAAIEDEFNHVTPIFVEELLTQWQEERATLIATIDTQRRELERREQAQQDAARLAETFATTVQAFAERLEIVERTTASELSEMKNMIAKQTAATELLLSALGLASSTNAVPPTTSSPTPSSTAGMRRETK